MVIVVESDSLGQLLGDVQIQREPLAVQIAEAERPAGDGVCASV